MGVKQYWGIQRAEEKGQALLETAFVLPLILLLAAAAVEVSLLLVRSLLTEYLAFSGARMAAVTDGSSVDDALRLFGGVTLGALDGGATAALYLQTSTQNFARDVEVRVRYVVPNRFRLVESWWKRVGMPFLQARCRLRREDEKVYSP